MEAFKVQRSQDNKEPSSLKERIFARIKERPGCSFVDLEDVDGFSGELTIFISENSNLVLWDMVSPEALKAMEELREEKRIFAHSTSLIVYLVDGKMLNLPIPKSTRGAMRCKKPHWLPTTFSTTPSK